MVTAAPSGTTSDGPDGPEPSRAFADELWTTATNGVGPAPSPVTPPRPPRRPTLFEILDPRRPESPPVTFLSLLASVIVACLVAAGAASLVNHAPTYFESEAVLLVDQPKAVAASGDAGELQKLSGLRFEYVDLIQTDRIAQPVATALHQPIGAVRGRIFGAASATALLLLDVGGTASTPLEAQRLAAATGQAVINDSVDDQNLYDIPYSERMIWTVVQPAGPGFPVTPASRRRETVAIVSGLLALAVAYVVFQAVAARRNRPLTR
jgi:capsular polysaccharide biosynthesis protein